MQLTEQQYSEKLEKANRCVANRQLSQAETLLHELREYDPSGIELHLLLSHVSELKGMHKEQLDYLTAILDAAEGRPEIWVRMAFAYLALGDFQSAKDTAIKVLLNPISTNADLRNTGKLFHAIGLYEYSAKAYALVVEKVEDNESVLYDLGMALTLSGKIDAAKKTYNKSIKTYPDFAMAYAGLSKVRTATLRSNNIPQIESLISKTRKPWSAINLYHCLAKELDDTGQYEAAMTALNTGKRKLRKVCPHTPSRCVDNVFAVKEVYQKKLDDIKAKAQPELVKGLTEHPIFVTGMPRSGTTVVERILTNHSDVVSIGERLQFSMAMKAQSRTRYTALVNARALEEQWNDTDFSLIGNHYLQSTRYLHEGAAWFVDKLPLNILYAGAILKALPQAKIVCLLRDPLDTLIGNYRQVFEYGSGTYTYTLDRMACAHFILAFRELAFWLESQFPEQFKIIRYEEIIHQPEAQAKNLLLFCGLSWQAHCVDIHKNQAAVGSASAAQVKEPIHRRAVGHAKHYRPWLDEIDKFFNEHVGNAL